jgi:hypothetical protein
MMSKSQPTRNGTPQVQSAIIIAIALFAFSGLMVGFAVGAFVRPAKQPTANNSNQTQIIANHPTPTSTPDPTPTTPVFIALGCPAFSNFSSAANADGTFKYSVTIQVKDKTGEQDGKCDVRQEKPITADGVTCRLWLVPKPDDPNNDQGTLFATSAANQLQNINMLNQPFPQEIQNGLVFDPATTSEVQPCTQGSAQWKFTIAPSVPKGNYNVIGLTDWQGKSYNWSWQTIAVAKQGQ